MAINERLIDTAVVSGCSAEPTEEGLQLHLDANDVDSYDGDGTEWIDITNHEYTPTTNVSEHFNTVLYPGNGGTKEVTGVGFQPDLVWIKRINGAGDPGMVDVIRGNNSALFTNSQTAESALTGGNISMDVDGFDINTYGSTWANLSGGEYASWCFKAGGAPNGSDKVSIDGTSYADEAAAGLTAGSASVVNLSANTKLGFSIVETGTYASSEKSYSHGLGVKPELIIVKSINDSSDWFVWTEGLTNSQKLLLNSTGGKATHVSLWGVSNTTPHNSNDFTFYGSSGQEYLAYCFASKRGVSKVGSYTGTAGAVDIDTGFEPAFVMIKWTSGSIGYGGWAIYDNKRDTTSPNSKLLQANSNSQEVDNVSYSITMTSTGFTVGSTQNDAINYNGNEYIYYAVAKNTNETSLIPDTNLQLHLDADSFPEYGEAGYSNTPSTWTDSSSNSNNGTISGGATFDSELGNWLDFDGGNDYVQIPSTATEPFEASARDFTLSMWINRDTAGYDPLITKYGTTSARRSWYFGINASGQLNMGWHNGSTIVYKTATSSVVNTPNKWYHVALSVNASTMDFYVNGVKESVTGSVTHTSGGNEPIVIGSQASGNYNFFNGQVGQARIYDTALTQAQITQNYNFTKPSYPNGYNFTGNNMDSADWNTNGYFSFNGSNEHFSSPSFTPSLTDVQTVSYWVRNSAISGGETVYSIGQTGNSNAYVWVSFGYDSTAGAVRAFYGDTIGDIRNGTKTNSAYISSDWQHHCFLIFPENRGTSSQCFKVYIDGVEVAVTNSTNSSSLPTVQGYPMIGRYSGQDVNRFNGDLSSLRVYDRRLTEAEITALHCAGR